MNKKHIKKCVPLMVLASAMIATGMVFASSSVLAEEVNDDDRAYCTLSKESTTEYGKDIHSEYEGLIATLDTHDTLIMRNVIDLNDFSKRDPFIEIMPVVQTVGMAEYTRVTLKVYDVYDESNYITIQLSATPDAGNTSDTSYILACASNGQKLSGMEGTKLHVDNQWGTWAYFSFGATQADNYLGFGYDVEENVIYAVNTWCNRQERIIDFDEYKHFGDLLWDGFTTGEVYCTLTCDGYVSDKAKLMVKKYGNTDLSIATLQDSAAPKLSVDYGEYTKENLPAAVVNKPYKVFDASAFDTIDGVRDVKTEVYLNYYSDQRMKVNIKAGAFTPKIANTHYIVYTSVDEAGNKAEEVVPVNAIASSEPVMITFGDVIMDAVEGDRYYIPEYTLSGGVGNLKLSITAILNNKVLQVIDDYIHLEEGGSLVIGYTVTDYVGQTYSTQHTVSVSEAAKPTFLEEPILPKYLISGNKYTLPSLNAYNYITASGTPISTAISVKENGVEKVLENGDYTVGNVSEAEIIYTAEVNGAIGTYKKLLPVYSVKKSNKLDMAKYFILDANGTAVSNFNGIQLTATKDTGFEFINWVSALSMRTEFTATTTTNKMQKFHIYLTDIVNQSKQIKFTYEFRTTGIVFYVNDDVNNANSVSGALTNNKRFEVRYDFANSKVFFDLSNEKTIQIKSFLNGNKLEDFTNDRVYVTYAVEGVDNSASFVINSLNGHTFSRETADYIAPTIEMKNELPSEAILGSTIIIPEIIACDVLSGDVNVYVSVLLPNKENAVSTDGKSLSNVLYTGKSLSFALPEYGEYVIVLSATDGNGNKAGINIITKVVDVEKPIIVLEHEIVQSVTLGQSVTIPSATVTDNRDANVNVNIYVFNPSGAVIMIGAQHNGFVANQVGIYTIVYNAMDAEGNCATIYKQVIVKEA